MRRGWVLLSAAAEAVGSSGSGSGNVQLPTPDAPTEPPIRQAVPPAPPAPRAVAASKNGQQAGVVGSSLEVALSKHINHGMRCHMKFEAQRAPALTARAEQCHFVVAGSMYVLSLHKSGELRWQTYTSITNKANYGLQVEQSSESAVRGTDAVLEALHAAKEMATLGFRDLALVDLALLHLSRAEGKTQLYRSMRLIADSIDSKAADQWTAHQHVRCAQMHKFNNSYFYATTSNPIFCEVAGSPKEKMASIGMSLMNLRKRDLFTQGARKDAACVAERAQAEVPPAKPTDAVGPSESTAATPTPSATPAPTTADAATLSHTWKDASVREAKAELAKMMGVGVRPPAHTCGIEVVGALHTSSSRFVCHDCGTQAMSAMELVGHCASEQHRSVHHPAGEYAFEQALISTLKANLELTWSLHTESER